MTKNHLAGAVWGVSFKEFSLTRFLTELFLNSLRNLQAVYRPPLSKESSNKKFLNEFSKEFGKQNSFEKETEKKISKSPPLPFLNDGV